jgi:hypothetical protein
VTTTCCEGDRGPTVAMPTRAKTAPTGPVNAYRTSRERLETRSRLKAFI